MPSPKELEEVKIGWFGPTSAEDAAAGLMWCAATLAIEEANRAGGFNGLPFRLVASWSDNPWGTGVRGITRLVYDEGVWAIAGAPDGPSAHLVEQVVAKARIVFVSPVSTDKTANLANVAWIFSCAPGDDIQAAVLGQALVARAAGESLAVVSSTDHDSRVFTAELLTALHELAAFPSAHLEFRPHCTDFTTQVQGLRQAGAAAVALIAGAQDSGRFMRACRAERVTVPVFGGSAMGRHPFYQAAGDCAEGVTFPLLWHPSVTGERSGEFAERFEQRFGIYPDYVAAYTYDAMNLLIAAISSAGLNRVRIRDAVRQLSPWNGVTGIITWDPTGRNRRSIHLGTIRNGQTEPRYPAGSALDQAGRALPAE